MSRIQLPTILAGILFFVSSSLASADFAISAFRTDTPRTGEDHGTKTSLAEAEAVAEDLASRRSALTGQYLFDRVEITADGVTRIIRPPQKIDEKKRPVEPPPKRRVEDEPTRDKLRVSRTPKSKSNDWGLLKGKRLAGRIGQSAVVFQFDSKESVVISGGMTGEGKGFVKDDSIEFETAVAKFRGVVTKDRVFGQRFEKGKSSIPLDWEITLTPPVNPENSRWTEDVFKRTYQLLPGNRLLIDGKGDVGAVQRRWKSEGNTIYMQTYGLDWDFKGQIQGNRLIGNHFNPHMNDPQAESRPESFTLNK